MISFIFSEQTLEGVEEEVDEDRVDGVVSEAQLSVAQTVKTTSSEHVSVQTDGNQQQQDDEPTEDAEEATDAQQGTSRAY